jgi:hypothetical protein
VKNKLVKPYMEIGRGGNGSGRKWVTKYIPIDTCAVTWRK